MKPPPAALWIGICATVLVAGLAWLLWPADRVPAIRPASGQDAAGESPSRPVTAREPGGGPATISPRPLGVSGQTAGGDAEAAQPANGAISGEVVDFDGNRRARVSVALFAMRDGAPHSKSEQRTTTDEQGRFRIPAGATAAAEVALVAFSAGRRPATLVVSKDAREPVRLVLGEGASIAGTVSLDGSPVRGAGVAADIRPGVAGSFSLQDELWWSGTAFETKLAYASCDQEGRFVLHGLAADTYHVQVTHLPIGADRSVGMTLQADVRAPASGVQLSLKTARVSVKVTAKGAAVEGAKVAVRDANGSTTLGPSGEPFTVRVAAGAPLTVEAAHAGFEPATVAVPPLESGETREVVVALVESTAPRLQLTLRGAKAMQLERVHVRFVPMTAPPQNENLALQDVRRTLIAHRSGDDEFVVDHIPHPPGPCIAVIGAGHPGWLVPIQQDVSIPAAGVLAISDDAVAGGRLEVIALDQAGRHLLGECIVRDSRGREVANRPVGLGWGGHFKLPRAYDARREALDFVRAMQVLAPGTYEIEVKIPEHPAARRSVTLRPNETTREEIRLEREPK